MAMKNCKLSLIAMILFSCILVMLGYIFIFKDKHDGLQSELNQQRVLFVIKDFEDYSDIDIEDNGGPVIAIIVDGIGFLNPGSNLDLPSQVTLGMPSYIPYKEYADNSAIIKHDVLLNIPLEPINYPEEDPDPEALLKDNSEQENVLRLNSILDRGENYHAVYSSHDDRYTNSYNEAETLLSGLKNRKLIYISGISDKNALVYQLAKKMHYHILENDIVLDAAISREEITEKLLELENIATTSGAAIALGSSYPLTIELLNEWIPSLAGKGIKLVSIQDFYKITLKRKALHISK